MDHLMAFGRYIYDTSKTIRRSRRRGQIVAGSLYVWFGALYFVEVPLGTILLWYLVATAYLLFVSYWHKRSYLKNLTKMYRETENKSFFCEHYLTITDAGIVAKDESSESTIFWSGIERVVNQVDFTFVFLGSVQAIVIPKVGVLEGDYEVFVAELKKRVAKNLAPEGVKAVD
jgi:hypothetical protein